MESGEKGRKVLIRSSVTTTPQPQAQIEITRISSPYALNLERSKEKLEKAANRVNVLETKWKGGNMIMSMSAGSFVLFKEGLCNINPKTNNWGIVMSTKEDLRGRREQTIFKFSHKQRPKKKFTINLYHTTCKALVNGSDLGPFRLEILPQMQDQSEANMQLINNIDEAIKHKISTMNGSTETKADKRTPIYHANTSSAEQIQESPVMTKIVKSKSVASGSPARALCRIETKCANQAVGNSTTNLVELLSPLAMSPTSTSNNSTCKIDIIREIPWNQETPSTSSIDISQFPLKQKQDSSQTKLPQTRQSPPKPQIATNSKIPIEAENRNKKCSTQKKKEELETEKRRLVIVEQNKEGMDERSTDSQDSHHSTYNQPTINLVTVSNSQTEPVMSKQVMTVTSTANTDDFQNSYKISTLSNINKPIMPQISTSRIAAPSDTPQNPSKFVSNNQSNMQYLNQLRTTIKDVTYNRKLFANPDTQTVGASSSAISKSCGPEPKGSHFNQIKIAQLLCDAVSTKLQSPSLEKFLPGNVEPQQDHVTQTKEQNHVPDNISALVRADSTPDTRSKTGDKEEEYELRIEPCPNLAASKQVQSAEQQATVQNQQEGVKQTKKTWACNQCKKRFGTKRPMIQCSWCDKVVCQKEECSGDSNLNLLSKFPTSVVWICGESCYEAIDSANKVNSECRSAIKQLETKLIQKEKESDQTKLARSKKEEQEIKEREIMQERIREVLEIARNKEQENVVMANLMSREEESSKQKLEQARNQIAKLKADHKKETSDILSQSEAKHQKLKKQYTATNKEINRETERLKVSRLVEEMNKIIGNQQMEIVNLNKKMEEEGTKQQLSPQQILMEKQNEELTNKLKGITEENNRLKEEIKTFQKRLEMTVTDNATKAKTIDNLCESLTSTNTINKALEITVSELNGGRISQYEIIRRTLQKTGEPQEENQNQVENNDEYIVLDEIEGEQNKEPKPSICDRLKKMAASQLQEAEQGRREPRTHRVERERGRNPTQRKNIICRFHAEGRCRYGKGCLYQHPGTNNVGSDISKNKDGNRNPKPGRQQKKMKEILLELLQELQSQTR